MSSQRVCSVCRAPEGVAREGHKMSCPVNRWGRPVVWKKIAGLLALLALLFFGATACSGYNDERGKGDAPVQNHKGEDSPKYVTNNPDGFGNVVTGCVWGATNLRYVLTTNTGNHPSNLVVVKDEECGP